MLKKSGLGSHFVGEYNHIERGYSLQIVERGSFIVDYPTSVLKPRSENTHEKSYGPVDVVKPWKYPTRQSRASREEVNRSITTHSTTTPPHPLYLTSDFSSASKQLSCHFVHLPAPNERRQQQLQQQYRSTAVRGRRGLFAKRPYWAPGVLGTQRSGAATPE